STIESVLSREWPAGLLQELFKKISTESTRGYRSISFYHLMKKLASKFNKKREERDKGDGGGRDVSIQYYQIYLKDSFTRLKRDLELLRRDNFIFAAKLVRGAYMV
ncbi:892_t:CDS:2, partial [Diversispora eburnea]